MRTAVHFLPHDTPRAFHLRAVLLKGLCLLAASQRLMGAEIPLEERVLVVYNSSVSESGAVAKYYMTQRKIPKNNTCRIAVTSTTAIGYDEFETRVKAPVRKCLESVGKQKILYIVFSFQTPYLLTVQGRIFSLDQAVADIWDEYSPAAPADQGAAHPYFADAQSEGNVYLPFVPLATYRDQPRALNIYSVWRLDAANADLARGLVDKAILAETYGLSGKGCFDRQFGPIDRVADNASGSGDWDIHQAAEFAKRAGFTVIEDDQPAEFGAAPAPLRCNGAALYAGWYSLNHYNDAFTWTPGAIGFHLDSASAADPRGGTNWSGNAVIKGITITSGAVAEPFLQGLPHPDEVFLYVFHGANLGDALLRSTRWLKWMIVNIGDPLYRPFRTGAAHFNWPASQDTILAVIPQSLIGGNAASGLVGLSHPAPRGGTTVTLHSSEPGVATVPQTITIPENANAAKFAINTHPVNSDGTTVRVSSAVGDATKSNTLVLYPLMAPLALNPARISGGEAAAGTVRLNQQAPAGEVTVKLSSGNPALVTVPEDIRIPGGASSATFRIATRAVTAETSIMITASNGGASRSATLTLVP